MGWGECGSSRAHSHIGTVEEQTHHKNHRHAACSGYKPQGEDAFGPAAFPGHGGAAIGKAIGDPAVRQGGFLAAHGSRKEVGVEG